MVSQYPPRKLTLATFGSEVAINRHAKSLGATQARLRVDSTERFTLNIALLFHGYAVSAPVDTGADYSRVNAKLSTIFKEVITPWPGTQIRTAGGNVGAPIITCTSRVRICESTFVARFFALRECCRHVILGVDFLQEYGLLSISKSIAPSSKPTEQSTSQMINSATTFFVCALIECNVLSVSQCCSLNHLLWIAKCEAVADSNLDHLLTQGVCSARSTRSFAMMNLSCLVRILVENIDTFSMVLT